MASLSIEERQLLEEKYNGVMSEGFEHDRVRLEAGEPLAYLVGWQPFLGLKIFLDSHPLIPRPETEWWVEELVKHAKLLPQLRMLDLCAGSGAIGCAILKHVLDAQVSFSEIDPAHSATIQKNISENALDTARASARAGNLFEPFPNEKFSIIATNPPYIPEARELPKSVLHYEPAIALRAGTDGLSLIRQIAKEAPAHLLPGGELWLECDSEHAEKALALVREGGATRAEIRNDHYGRPRLIVGYYL